MPDATPSTPAPSPSKLERAIASAELIGRTASRAIAPLRTQIAERRDLRAPAAGITLIVLSWLGAGGASWQMPLVVAGLSLIAIGLIGSRFSGTMQLSWGSDGINLELSSRVVARATAIESGSEPDPIAIAPAIPPSEIEGHAETIEIHVAEIKAALASAAQNGSEHQKIA